MAKLIVKDGLFCFVGAFGDRDKARKAGFRWDTARKAWVTSEMAAAVRLRSIAVGRAKTILERATLRIEPWLSPLPPTPEGKTLFKHQLEAIRFALGRSRSYLGLDPGLGKTACAAVIAAAVKRTTIYVSPPFLVRNIVREFANWAPQLTTTVVQTAKPFDITADVFVVPDTLLTRDVVDDITALTAPGLVIVDEAHRFKNVQAQRTQALFGYRTMPGLVTGVPRHVYMSGTPMPNRPIELYAVLRAAAPETIDFADMNEYGQRFCGGYWDGRAWDFSGASNLPDLAVKVIAPTGPFMIRMKKDLLQLPPKIEEIFLLSENASAEILELDKKVAREADFSGGVPRIHHENKDSHQAVYRRLLGEAKAKAILPYLKSLLEEGDEALLVFAYHKDAVRILEEGLAAFDPLVITGATPTAGRQDLVNEFQNNPRRRLFIANYLAAGTGFTLTKARRVVFVEFSWVPGDNDQAGDRTHRIGQTRSVLVQFVVYDKTLDNRVIETLIKKRRAIEHV